MHAGIAAAAVRPEWTYPDSSGPTSSWRRPADISAVDKLHRDVVRAATLANFVDVRDVGMVERRGRLCLAHEALHAIAIRTNIGGQNFQCDFAIESCVLRQINLTHPARANLRADFVAAEFCSCYQTHR